VLAHLIAAVGGDPDAVRTAVAAGISTPGGPAGAPGTTGA
jgi:hypothetical protein